MVTRKNLTDYQYSLYEDYLGQLDGILTKYGQQSGLSIEYWHIRVDESMNYDDLKIQNSYKHYVYDLYHFLPTINMTSLTYQIGMNQQQQGTSNVASGSFSTYLLEQPIPGDVFRFYPYGGTTDRTEIFRITNVRYMRTSKEKLDLYQLDFETAPMLVDTLEHVRINEIFCWDTENHKFQNEFICNNMECILKCRDELVTKINDWYDEQNGWYGLCKGGGSTLDWSTLCLPKNDRTGLRESDECEDGLLPDWPTWPPGPDWPGWSPDPDWTNPDPEPGKSCGGGSTTRPLVFLNTILKRIKKIYSAVELKPIYGIGTAKIPIEWILPTYETPDPIDPTVNVTARRDYWDTFTCLSYQPQATAGELFNVTKILNGECQDCPPELVQEIECHRELYILVMALVMVLEQLLTPEQLQDATCDRKCCDMFDPNFVGRCLTWASTGDGTFDKLFWDANGPAAGENAKTFCEQYANIDLACVPLYITWRDGAKWPEGGRVG